MLTYLWSKSVAKTLGDIISNITTPLCLDFSIIRSNEFLFPYIFLDDTTSTIPGMKTTEPKFPGQKLESLLPNGMANWVNS